MAAAEFTSKTITQFGPFNSSIRLLECTGTSPGDNADFFTVTGLTTVYGVFAKVLGENVIGTTTSATNVITFTNAQGGTSKVWHMIVWGV
jgi:hypothetical protein